MKKPRIPATPMPTCVMFCIMDSGRLMPTRANMAAKDAQLEGSFNRFRIMSMVISFVKFSGHSRERIVRYPEEDPERPGS